MPACFCCHAIAFWQLLNTRICYVMLCYRTIVCLTVWLYVCLLTWCTVAKRLDRSGCHLVWGRPRPRRHCVIGDQAPRKGAQQPPLFGPYLLWPNGRPSQQLLSSCYIYVLLQVLNFSLCVLFARLLSKEMTVDLDICHDGSTWPILGQVCRSRSYVRVHKRLKLVVLLYMTA